MVGDQAVTKKKQYVEQMDSEAPPYSRALIQSSEITMRNIRQANPDDSAEIKALVADTLLQRVLDAGEPYDKLLSKIGTLIDTWVCNPNDSIHLVCEQNDEIIGIVFVSHHERLNLLFVQSSQQKSGIGEALLDRALEVCRHEGKSCQLTLNSSSYAAPFYLKYGFTQDGDAINRPGGCIPMKINL